MPQHFWAFFQFYRQQLGPICGALWAPNNGHLCSHSESKRYAARACATLHTNTHTHNSLAGMTRSAWKAVCVSAWIRAMYQVSSQRSTVTVWRNMAENEKMRKTERGLQTHIQANTSLHTPSFTRWDLFYGLATMKNTYKNTFLTTAGAWCGVAVNRSLTQEQTWNKVKGEPSTGTIALLQHLVKHFVSWGIRLHTECPQGGQWRNYYLPIYNNRRDRNWVENRQHIKVTRTL